MSKLFEPFAMGSHRLANRIAMAPLTRSRARPHNVPSDLAPLYYAQRGEAGLIVTEGTAISPNAIGYLDVPGLWTAEQVEAWKPVTKAVHERGAVIFTQLWHVGRVSHVSTQPGRAAPVSSTSRIAADSQAFGLRDDGTAALVDVSTPRALTTEEVRGVTADFVRAARNAIEAGFDGIELHGANGYLIEQFLNPNVNDRTDAYRGDTLEGRTRFLLETLDAVIAAIGAERTAVRLSPYGQLFDNPAYPEIEETYLYLADEFSRRGIAYVHLMDQSTRGSTGTPPDFLAKFRTHFKGTLILAGGMTRERAEQMIDAGLIDVAAFGEPFIANPDLVTRLRNRWPIAESDRTIHYGGGARGYTDFPVYSPEGMTA
ncbi:alkene reductase [Sphingomonas sp. OTU376]|uniref:alkene reductase n=1 Tax=Sphingomonas sp. OTU376 TaxID=3043863 RepID=UPI00313D57D6